MSQSGAPKFSNIFDDNDISFEKLSYYRLSQPLPISPKKRLYRFLGLKSDQQNLNLLPLTSNLSKDNFSPKSTKSCQIENPLPEKNLYDSMYSHESIKMIENEERLKNFPKSLEHLDHSIIPRDLNKKSLQKRTNEIIFEELLESCENISQANKDSEMVVNIPKRASDNFNQINLKENLESHQKQGSLKINKCTSVFYHISSPKDDIDQQKTLDSSSDFDLAPIPGFSPVIFPKNVSKFDKETELFNFDGKYKQPSVPISKLYEEKSLCTFDLILTKDQFMETEKTVVKEKSFDTKDLIKTHDQNIGTDPDHFEKEKENFSQEKIKVFKQQTLLKLNSIKLELDDLKRGHPLAEDIQFMFESKIKNLKNVMMSNLNSYFSKREAESKTKFLILKENILETKKEFFEVKTQVSDILEKTKEKMIQSFQKDMEKELRNIVALPTNPKVSNPSVNKLNEFMSENYSISTQSNFCSPIKYRNGNILENQTIESLPQPQTKKYTKKKPKKVNKAIVDGMLYLLENGAVKSCMKEEDELKKQMEELIKTKSKEKLTSDIVLENLMDKTRKKQINFQQIADKKVKRKSSRLRGESPKKKIHLEEEPEKPHPPVIMIIDLTKKDS